MIGPKLLHVDIRELQKLERHLAKARIQAFPYAAQQTINTQAFEAQRFWKEDLPGKMILRNRFTEQAIQVDKAKTLDMDRMQSTVGSVASYMDEQEHGATLPKEGKHGVPVPAKPMGKRKMAKANHFKSIKLMPRVRGHRSRQVAAALSMARKRGAPQYAFLKMRKGKQGIYRLDPNKKRAAVRKVWSLAKSSVTVPKNPTMQPATLKAAKLRDGIWREALIFQLKRARVFGY